jgi:hypothetical protein
MPGFLSLLAPSEAARPPSENSLIVRQIDPFIIDLASILAFNRSSTQFFPCSEGARVRMATACAAGSSVRRSLPARRAGCARWPRE